MGEVLVMVVGLLTIGSAFFYWRSARIAAAAEARADEAKQGYAALTQGADVELGLLRGQVEAARIERDEAKRRSDEYFRMIEVANSERDGWRQLYMEQASAHSNAQQLMMTQINTLAFVYERDTKKKPQIAPIIQTVRDDFQQNHGAEAVQARLAK
jgi:hypothetical protein